MDNIQLGLRGFLLVFFGMKTPSLLCCGVAVAFAITFTTAALLRAASLRLLPRSLLPFVPPKPLPVPVCWAPFITPSSVRASIGCRTPPSMPSPNHPTTPSRTTSVTHTQTTPLNTLAAGHLSGGAPATGNTPGGTAVTLAAQPLYLSTEAASVITPDRVPAARRSLTVRFALSSDGSAERTFGGPQAALR